MRQLTYQDLSDIIGMNIAGYKVIRIRRKKDSFTDSHNYGIILAVNKNKYYVTWQFHLDEDNKPTAYWGHYFNNSHNAAIHDFSTRDSYDVQV